MNAKFRLHMLSASLLACAFGISGQAQANAYAVSTDNIKNGFIFATVNGVPQQQGNAFINFGSPASSSSTSATLNGSGTTNNAVGPAPDALASNGTGSVPTRTNEFTFTTGAGNTYYTLFGQLPTAYSWGDAIVVSEQSTTGTPIVARNAAESNIPVTGFADANGRNDSSTTLTIPLNIGPSCGDPGVVCRVDFSFLADPYIQAVLDALAGGVVARGALTLTITLTPVGSLVPIFAWAPNGAVDNDAFGGTELADAENLNQTQSALFPGQTQTFSAPYGSDIFGFYHAITNPLLPGQYTLSLSMVEHTDVQRTTSVPEPASLALLGLGLGAMALARRRKQA
jgi:hypothetical protein